MLDDTGVKDVLASVLQGELIKRRYRYFLNGNILTGIFPSSVPGLTTVRFLDLHSSGQGIPNPSNSPS
jgi:hypothetical protein